MTSAVYIGRRRAGSLPEGNRGLAFGDGVFETMRVHAGALPLWPRHLARLRAGAARLGIPMPDIAFVEACIAELAAGCESGVLKLLLTRGAGARGYAATPDAPPEWLLSLHPLPTPPPAGLRLRWCDTRLARQPALAGIKHCNRLEQVLGRAEVDAAGCDEGLMRDRHGRVVCATAANLLVLRDGRWSTPPVDACGVAGVLRGWLLEGDMADVAPMRRDGVESAQAVALCNAVRGILPVASLGARQWAPHPRLAELQGRLAMAYPMFRTAGGAA